MINTYHGLATKIQCLKLKSTYTPKVEDEISKFIKCSYSSGSCVFNNVSRILESFGTSSSLSEVLLYNYLNYK